MSTSTETIRKDGDVMDNRTYDMYRNLGWTPEEIWEFATEMEHTDDGITEED